MLPSNELFLLDARTTYLNHGGFGATPKAVFEAYQRVQRELEANPTHFFEVVLPEKLSRMRERFAAFLNAEVQGLLPVPSRHFAINAVAQSLNLGPGDQVLATDHESGESDRIWETICRRQGAQYLRRKLPLPKESDEAWAEAIWAGLSPSTKLIFVSHVGRSTGAILPVDKLLTRARAAAIPCCIDGSDVPGHIRLDIGEIQPDYYIGNAYRWLMAPKGAAFLWVSKKYRGSLLPSVVWPIWPDASPGKRARSRESYSYIGMGDPAAQICITDALAFWLDNRWEDVAADCRAIARKVRDMLGGIGGEHLYRDQDFGQMFAVTLPFTDTVRLKSWLFGQWQIEVPVFEWHGLSMVRVSIQGYNRLSDGERLAQALQTWFQGESS